MEHWNRKRGVSVGTSQRKALIQYDLPAFRNPGSSNWFKKAEMSVERYASHYSMNHPLRGIACILSHELCDNGRVKPRRGTHLEAGQLAAALLALGFIVTIHKDKTKSEIEDLIKTIAKDDHHSTSCLLIAVLSQGNLQSGIYAKDDTYPLDSIWNPFVANLCPGLAGKPKCFFIQECPIFIADKFTPRGSQKSFVDGQALSYKIPSHADFLIFHTVQAASFMDVLCEELQRTDIAKYHILQLLTFVNGRFARLYPGDSAAGCCITTRLTRLLELQQREGGRIIELEALVLPDAEPTNEVALSNELALPNQLTMSIELVLSDISVMLTALVSQNQITQAQNTEIITLLKDKNQPPLEARIERRRQNSSWWNCFKSSR